MHLQQALDQAVHHHRSGRLAEAEQLYRQILTHQPDHADALHLLGVIAQQMGRHYMSEVLISRAIAIKADWPEALNNRGESLRSQGRLDEAIAGYRQAIALKPDYPEAFSNLGSALKDKGQLDEAVAAFQRAITLRPGYADALSNLGVAYSERGQAGDAVAAYRQAIALNPGNHVAHNNLGNALKDQGELDEAIAAYRKAIALKPDYAEALANLGVGLNEKGRLEEAINVCRNAIALNPDFAEFHCNLAFTLLLRGDFSSGWPENEWRSRTKHFRSTLPADRPIQWDGSELAERTLMIHCEQGFGDTLQFMRYIPLAAERCGQVIATCQPELLRLLQLMPGPRWTTKLEPLPEPHVHCLLLSLPRILGTTLETIPHDVPYLHAKADEIARWRHRLGAHTGSPPLAGTGTSLKIGLAWAGRPTHTNDRNRSLPLSALAPLASVPGVTFVGLQTGAAGSQAEDPPTGMTLADWTEDLHDFADTAALIANLDLVISVDTAVAHLAGAMGKPVWTLLPFAPDWRWLLDRDDSPWYPTMRLFRQRSRGDWISLIEEVADALRLWAVKQKMVARENR